MRDDLGLYRHLCFVSVHNISLHCVPKNWTTKLIAVTLSNLNRFSKLFTVRLSDKFAIKVIVKDPTTPKTRCYPTLWNMSSRNRHAQELHEQTIGLVETTTHTRFSHWKLLSKNTHLMMWALSNSLTRRYLPRTHRITDCTQLPQQRRKTPQQNPFTHYQRSVTVSDDVSWQVKIGLHQFDNYLSQIEINVKTVNNSHTQDICRVLRLSAGKCPGTQSPWDNKLSCLAVT